MSKRILIIAKHFPPRNHARALQAQRFVNALSRVKGIDLKVVAGLDTSTSCLSYERDNKNVYYIKYSDVNCFSLKWSLLAQSILELNIYNSWARKVEKKIQEFLILESWKPELIISLSSPIDSHWPTLKLKPYDCKIFNFFSDPWPKKILPEPYNRSALPIVSAIQFYLLKKLAASSDGFIFTNEKAINTLLNNKVIPRSHYILPHFSSEDDEIPVDIDNCKMVSYIGSADDKRITNSLLNALRKFIENNTEFKVLFAGYRTEKLDATIRNTLGHANVILLEHLSVGQAKYIAKNSTILVSSEGDLDNSPFIPSKLADYICSTTPILAITKSGSASCLLLENNDIPYFISDNSEVEILHGLDYLKDKKRNGLSKELYVSYNDSIINDFMKLDLF